jgi:hypothetical protein
MCMRECRAGEKCPDKARCMAIMRKTAKRQSAVQVVARERKAQRARIA